MSEITKPKTKLEIAKAKKDKLLKEAEKTKRTIKLLEAKAKRFEARENREVDKRMKSHAGGIIEMTGLMRYVYPNNVLHDNEQDALIANLLAGVLLKVGSTLEKANADELKNLWEQGRDFRKLKKADRVLPKVNSNLDLLFEKLNLKVTDTIQQPNDNDNLKISPAIKVESENSN